MAVAVEDGRRADNAEVDVAAVVEDGAAAAPAAHKGNVAAGGGAGHGVVDGGEVVEEAEVDLEPGVLVAADDYAWVVGVEEEDAGVWVRVLQQEVLCREIEVGVVAARRVDLDAACGVCGLRVPGGGGEGPAIRRGCPSGLDMHSSRVAP